MQTAKICKAEGATEVGTFSTDLTSAAARETLISDICSAHGHIDVLVSHDSRKIDFIVATWIPATLVPSEASESAGLYVLETAPAQHSILQTAGCFKHIQARDI